MIFGTIKSIHNSIVKCCPKIKDLIFMLTPRYLTKSRFKIAVECPTKLFYTNKRNEYKDSLLDNEFLAMLAEGGYQVGELAKKLYPSGIEINETDHEVAEIKTSKLLQQENVVLFEPAIRVGNFFIRIDILIKEGNRLDLVEVKAKSYNSIAPEIEGAKGNISSSMLPYMQDVAFQTLVLRQAMPKANIHSFLMMPDKSKKAPIDGVNQIFKITKAGNIETRIPNGVNIKEIAELLLAKVPVDRYVNHILNTEIDYPGGPSNLINAANGWALAYEKDIKIPPVIGSQCSTCQFKTTPDDLLKSGFDECWKTATGISDEDLKKGTVLDLWNYRSKKALIEKGVYKITQVAREDLGEFEDETDLNGLTRSQRQWLQVNGIPTDRMHEGFYFNDTFIAREMSNWTYPFHFIDFETSTVSLPFYSEMHPYESVAFQFSHHILKEDGTVIHANEFLSVEPGVFPNYEFVRALKNALFNDVGTVFMWSHHENNILLAILKQLGEESNKPIDADELSAFIKTLIKGGDRAMIDLCKISEKVYFHPETNGSNSIKKVLPAILKSSKHLQEIYSKPIYGAENGIPSKNYSNHTWLNIKDGEITDPYKILKDYSRNLPTEEFENIEAIDYSVISAGGAASTAYSRLQFEDISEGSRKRIKAALLRYCELDTLAMVMIVEAWKDWVAN